MSKKERRTEGSEVLRKYTEHLTCKLTPDEQRAKGEQLARVIGDVANEDARQVMLKQDMKSRLAALEAKRDQLAAEVSRCEELREIEIEERIDFTVGKVYKTRLDTGVSIHERPVRDEERQMELAGMGVAH